MKTVLIETSGWALVVLGVAGFFLPVLPGVLFVLIGFALLSAKHHWARRWFYKMGDRYPHVRRKLRQFMGRHARHIPGLENGPETSFADES